MEPSEQKIGLSLKAVTQDLTAEEIRSYLEGQERDAGATLGDAFRHGSLDGEAEEDEDESGADSQRD
jgi:hypothetical protein